MAKRYGRNQRRRAREYIKTLEQDLDTAAERRREIVRELGELKRTIHTAKEDGFNAFMRQQGHIDRCMDVIGREFARLIEPQLRQHALKLLAAAIRSQDEPLRFCLDQSYTDKTVEVLRGELKPLNYNIALL